MYVYIVMELFWAAGITAITKSRDLKNISRSWIARQPRSQILQSVSNVFCNFIETCCTQLSKHLASQ